MLGRHELRQLAQRVTARYHLSALSRQETEDYIRHRLSVAGRRRARPASPRRARRRASALRGGPAPHQPVCDRALLAGYVAESARIDAGMVRRAAGEVLGRPEPPPAAGRAGGRRRRGGVHAAPGAAGVALAPRPRAAPDAARTSGDDPRRRDVSASRRLPPGGLPRRPARSTPSCAACPATRRSLAATARVQSRLCGARPPRARGSAHPARPGPRAWTCRWCSRCSHPRAPTPVSRAPAPGRRRRPSCASATSRRLGCRSRGRPPVDAAGRFPVAGPEELAAASDPGRGRRLGARAWPAWGTCASADLLAAVARFQQQTPASWRTGGMGRAHAHGPLQRCRPASARASRPERAS